MITGEALNRYSVTEALAEHSHSSLYHTSRTFGKDGLKNLEFT